MATSWAKCPDLFLYTKGNDVYLWRCKDETTWMPMITANFDDLGKVTDYLDLIGGKEDSILYWEKSSYIDLVAYISPRRLLVNSRGLVIAELGKFGQDGKMEENEQPFYIRSLDVLSFKPFGLRDRTIPRRTVRYLETEGKAALVEDSTSTELDDGKRADLEKEVAELKDANKTLKSDKEAAEKQVTELKEANKTLKSDKEAAEKQVTKLKENNKTLKSDKEAAEKQVTDLKERNKSLVADVAAQKAVAEKAKQERDQAKRDKEAAEKQVTDLKERNKSLVADVAAQKTVAEKAKQERDQAKRDKEAAERKAADLQTLIDSLNINQNIVWMNQFSDQNGHWTTFEGLRKEIIPVAVTARPGNFINTDEDPTTNVRASLMYYMQLSDGNNKLLMDLPQGTPGFYGYKAVRLDELIPSKEKARFSIYEWHRGMYMGQMYAIKEKFPGS